MLFIEFFTLAVLIFKTSVGEFLKEFDDTITFDLQWTDQIVKDYLQPAHTETLVARTSDKEKYVCTLPKIPGKEKYGDGMHVGVNPLDLLAPVLSNPSQCFHRMESYWKYELCHGKFIRQYHEKMRGENIILQEYYLGKWDKDQKNKYYEELEKSKLSPIAPTKKINGMNMPYLLINMTNGTVCDVNNKARSTRVYYVCYEHGKYEIASVEETSICEYEIVVLSPHLCKHAKYKFEKSTTNVIKCQPIEGAPKKPKSLSALEAESLNVKNRNLFDNDPRNMHVEIHPIMIAVDMKLKSTAVPSFPIASILQRFLSGEHCIVGRSGWWSYEFCYGVSISQFHRERNGEKVILYLGKFVKNKHLEWLVKNPHKRPKPIATRNQISHLYSDGTICDKTGQSRKTEVRLKCIKNSPTPYTITIFMYEPKLCEYVLYIESPFICDVLPYADENGIISNIKETNNSNGIIFPPNVDDIN